MEKKTIVEWMAQNNVRPAIHDDVLYSDMTPYTYEEFLEKIPYDTQVPLFNEGTEDTNLTNEVDRLAEVRTLIKELQTEEKELKDKMLEDGRDEIPGSNCRVVITKRSSETFNEEAFVTAFLADDNFTDELKSEILETKVVTTVNQEKLMDACKKEIISLDYVKPFSEIKISKIVNIK